VSLLNESQRTALGYWWNLITDAVSQGFTLTDTTQLANQVAQDFGSSLSFQENRDIGVLYGYAKRMDNAAVAFQQAPEGSLITQDIIALAPYARDVAERNSYPLYHVKFYYTYLDANGVEQTGIRTSVMPMTLGSDISGVLDEIQDDASAFALKYGHQLISAVPFKIVAV